MKILSQRHRDLIVQALGHDELTCAPQHICILDAGQALPAGVKPAHCIVLLESEGAHEVIAEAAALRAHHVLPTNHPYFARELKQALRELSHDQTFFDNPFQTLLNGNDCDVHHSNVKVISSIAAKSKNIDLLVSELQTHRPARTIWENVQSITDELLMNAMYDAPMMAGAGKGYPAELFWGFDSERFAVCVRDHYGSINTEAVLKRLQKVYSEGIGQAMNMGSGGAGIGMRLIFDRCSSLHIAVIPGTQTLVCCVLNLNRSRRILETEEKSLHILEKKSA